MGHMKSIPVGARPAGRVEEIVGTGLSYRPGDPVVLRVVRRPHRITISDDGAGARRAGRPAGWREAGQRLGRELDVNVTRTGAVSLPVVEVGPPETVVISRIAEASVALYETLLEIAP
jgi:hypothetical protein